LIIKEIIDSSHHFLVSLASEKASLPINKTAAATGAVTASNKTQIFARFSNQLWEKATFLKSRFILHDAFKRQEIDATGFLIGFAFTSNLSDKRRDKLK
jgi:hypothetical protein